MLRVFQIVGDDGNCHEFRCLVVDQKLGASDSHLILSARQSFMISSGSPQPSKTSFFAELLAPEIRLR